MNNLRFARVCWSFLLYNLAAIAWGVFVRASKSGDGCGSHWPLCDGSSTPLNGPIAKVVESSHRISTSLVGLFAIGLLIWAFRLFPKGNLIRRATVVTLAFTLVEGLVGAMLVKFQLVVNNDSALRLAIMGLHVVSTFMLLGSIAIAALAASEVDIRPRWSGQRSVLAILGMSGFGMIFLAVSGAVSALGHTLRPTDNVLSAAMDPRTFWMVRLQPLHPLIAVSGGLYLLLAAGLIQHLRPDEHVIRATRWMVGLYGVQLALGVVNIWLKAPIPLQMAHLAVADLNWVSLVAVSAYSLRYGVKSVEDIPVPEELVTGAPLTPRELVKAYVALTKPRIISLLLFTTLTSAVAAKAGWPGGWLMTALFVGGYMAAGAANAINMVIDRDIDFSMVRTRGRPTVTQSISSRNALTFAFSLAIGSFAILWASSNLLAAVLALSGLVFYVVVYTMLLKRRTWHNIVIGGAAGAFPPLVGWAAVSNDLPPLALYLFAIIFVWTPVHFWALALLLKDDYAQAGVPMLPVVKGDQYTVKQIAVYTLITVVVTLIPFTMPKVGYIYGGTAIVLNLLLMRDVFRLYKQIDRPRASHLFHYSMIYLAVLFLMFAVDRAVVGG